MTFQAKFRPTAEQLALIDRFLAAYNAIDRQLRFALGEGEELSFAQLIKKYYAKYPTWTASGKALLEYSSIRNILIHNSTEHDRYLSVPLAGVVEDIELIADSLRKPIKVIPKYQCQVITIGIDEPILKALRIIYPENFSQLPVYDGETFKGVLTENGIARWLARHLTAEMELIDFSEVPIRMALREEEKRPNFEFVAPWHFGVRSSEKIRDQP